MIPQLVPRVVTAAALGLAIAILADHPCHAAEAAIGKPAPDFTLKAASGKSVSLADYKGKYVVLEWTNHECPFVKKFYDKGDMPKLQKTAMKAGDVVWFQIVSSAPGKQGYVDADKAKEVRTATQTASADTLLDPDGKVGQLYGAKTTPHMYIIDPKGVLIYAGGIDDKKSTNPADIASAKNYVLVALEEAKAGKPVSTTTSTPYGCSVKY